MNNENGGINLQKNQESTKEHNSKFQKFVMTSVSHCQHNFSNIDSTMHCCQMSKADPDHVDFLIRTKLIGL
jgi:SH3-like domain-containing protein